LKFNKNYKVKSINPAQGTKTPNIICLPLRVAIAAIFLLGGCATPEKASSLPPAFGVLEQSGLGRDQKKRLARAETDFNRILEGRNPRYAYALPFFYMDGGTQIYQGDGYQLTSLRKITKRDGKDGYIVGPRIKLNHEITGGGPVFHGRTFFVTKENLPRRPSAGKRSMDGLEEILPGCLR
jgi:hypothetical protein